MNEEKEESKCTKIENALWSFCKGVLSLGTYWGVQFILVFALSAGVSSGLFSVGYALVVCVLVSAMIHVCILLSTI